MKKFLQTSALGLILIPGIGFAQTPDFSLNEEQESKISSIKSQNSVFLLEENNFELVDSNSISQEEYYGNEISNLKWGTFSLTRGTRGIKVSTPLLKTFYTVEDMYSAGYNLKNIYTVGLSNLNYHKISENILDLVFPSNLNKTIKPYLSTFITYLPSISKYFSF